MSSGGAGPSRRDRRFGVFVALLAAVTLIGMVRGRVGLVSTLVFNDARGARFTVPDLPVPTGATVAVLGGMIAAIAAMLVLRGLRDRAALGVGVAGALFILASLVWASSGTTISMIGLLRGSLFAAVPITLGALAGVLCERAGVINIAIEGQFLFAAFSAALIGSVLASPWWGLLGGIGGGVGIAILLALLTIRFQADQIVSGVILIVLATGVTSFLTTQVFAASPQLNGPPRFGPVPTGILGEIPVIGPVLLRQTVLVHLMIVLVIVLQFGLFRTRWGLRLRSVGEHPAAADTVGISVEKTRTRAVLLGGVLAGIGGSWFTLEASSQFAKEMTGGRGFIALAAMLVGRYSPVGALGAALLFGFTDSLATSLQRLPVPIPSTLLRAAPYVLTLAVVAGLVGRLRVPAADGKPYVKA